MKKEKVKVILLIFNLILTILLLGSLGIFSYFLLKLNVIPTKYLIIFFGLMSLIILSMLICLYKKGKVFLKIICVLFIFGFSYLFLYGTEYLIKTHDFIEITTKKDYDTVSFSVIILKESNYKTINDLKNKNIFYLDNVYKKDIKSALEKISYNENLQLEFGNIIDELFAKNADAIVLEDSYIPIVEEEMENFSDWTKVIYTFEIKQKPYTEQKEEKKPVEITMNPFIVYVSGIDQWGNVNSVRGRSDVNQLIVVNPKTNHILIVNTPRDYYVQLDGTTGLRDKLTHAGIYGIEKSIKTLENLYNIDITHYVRVNFNTVVKLVDSIGGISINSDKAFRAWTNKNVYVQEGWNNFDGAAALAYARERYAYLTGDHHRGANQQQVITAIFEKIANSTVLVSNYMNILESLNGTFNTDMTTDEITSFIRYQLDKMPSWKIDTYAVVGSGSSDYTYSMGTKYKLYVMEPNMSTVNIAKEKIMGVLNEK